MTLSVICGEEVGLKPLSHAQAGRISDRLTCAKPYLLVSSRAAVDIAINPINLIIRNGGAGLSTGYEIGDSEGCAAEIYEEPSSDLANLFQMPSERRLSAHRCRTTHINSARHRLRQVEENEEILTLGSG